MHSVFAAISIILAEVSLILLLISSALIFFKIRGQRKDKAALTLLTEKIKTGEEERLNVLSIKLQESQDIKGDALTAAAKETYSKEIDFYITMMTIYAKRESDALGEIHQKVALLAESYAKLGSQQSTVSPVDTSNEANQELTALTAENAELKNKINVSEALNERLEKELEATKKEMRETEAEFLSAFSGGHDAAEALITKKQQQRNDANENKTTTDNQPSNALDDALEVDQASATTEEKSPDTDSTDTQTSVTGEDSNTAESSEPETLEEESNPFLSIDDIDDDEAKATDNLIDSAMSDDDLHIDIDIAQNQDQPVPKSESAAIENTTPPAEPSTASAAEISAADDSVIEDTKAHEDETSASDTDARKVEPELKDDDINIDDILAAADEAQNIPDNTKVTPSADPEINDDDIDAILNDIDFSPPTENKEATEKTG